MKIRKPDTKDLYAATTTRCSSAFLASVLDFVRERESENRHTVMK